MSSIIRRSTLLIPTGSTADPNKRHLFVVLCDPVGRYGEALLVSISTTPNDGRRFDGTCLLSPGDHPFVKVDSFVEYRWARIEHESQLRQGLQGGAFIARDPVSEPVFKRILDGVRMSPFTERRIVTFLRVNGL